MKLSMFTSRLIDNQMIMQRQFFNRSRKIFQRLSSNAEKALPAPSLIGRSYIEPVDFSDEEIKSLLWTAAEFKTLSNDDYQNNNLENKSATLLLSEPNIHFQCAIKNASRFLKVPVKVIVDPTWETWQFPEDAGRILGKTCDVIFLKNVFHSKAKALATGANVPVIVLSSKRFANLRALSDIFTLREHFDYLQNLHVCWIGSPTSLINTYLLTMPRLGVKMKYFCCHLFGEKVSPITLPAAKGQKSFAENCQEASSMEEALSHSKILAMGADLGGQKQINEQNCKEADHDFYIFHSMPRTRVEICPLLFKSERNLTWKSYRNYEWLLTAFIVRTLVDHKHITKPLNYAEIKTTK